MYVQMKVHEEFSSDMLYTDKLLVQNTRASKDPTHPNFMEDKIYGEVVDETTSECFSPTLLMESSTDNQNYQVLAKESNEPQLASDTTAEVSSLIS
jgi:hypothetical protein